MTTDPIKRAWQSSVEAGNTPALAEVSAGADKFYRVVRRRNFIEYAACVCAAVVFTAYVLWLPHPLEKLGSALVVAATIYAAFQLHRRASAVAPEAAGAMPVLAFSRSQLVRHRDALRSMFWWYLLPFIPGFVLITLGSASRRAGETTGIVMLNVVEWAVLGFGGAVFAGIWWLNQRVARKLQRQIDEIDALTGETE